MQTLDIKEAAELLKMHRETVRAFAQAKRIPAAKPGRSWVFVKEDLIAWIRDQYNEETTHRDESCCIADQIRESGGLESQPQVAKKYHDLLEQKTKKKQKPMKPN